MVPLQSRLHGSLQKVGDWKAVPRKSNLRKNKEEGWTIGLAAENKRYLMVRR
jgi:hypothetical protein